MAAPPALVRPCGRSSSPTCTSAPRRGTDLLRRPELRAPLLEAVRGADRLVILGDGVELRDGAAARRRRARRRRCSPTSARRSAPTASCCWSAGNHDHGLVAGWIDGRLQTEPSGFLGLEQRIEPARRRPARRARWPSTPRRRACASPTRACGCATTSTRSTATTPTCTRRCRPSSGSPRARWRAGSCALPDDGATPDDYEAVLAPLYAWMHALTQRSEHAADHRRRGRLRARLGRARRRAAAAGARCAPPRSAPATRPRSRRINALGLGPARPRPLRRRRCAAATCAASARCCAASASRAPHVIWGHSHRSGPWPGDDPAEWTTPRRRAHRSTPARGSTSAHFLTRRAERLALLAGHRGRASTTSEPPRLSGCWATGATRSCDPRREARRVARRRPAPTSSSSTPAVWCGCSTSG